jgi:hypothetical protein
MARSISDHNGESTVYDHNVDTGSEQVDGLPDNPHSPLL